jgi:pyruvate,water dikinase
MPAPIDEAFRMSKVEPCLCFPNRWNTCVPAAALASNHYLPKTYQKTLEGYFRMAQSPLESPLKAPSKSGAYMIAPFAFCKQRLSEISDQTVARMVAGMDARSSAPMKKCAGWHGARWNWRARGFPKGARSMTSLPRWKTGDPDGGEELATSRDPWFNINVGDGFYHYHCS